MYNEYRISGIRGEFLMNEMIIDREKIKAEFIAKNLYTEQKELIKQRRIRIFVMSILVAALLLTTIYGTLENPFQYTFSNIGNFFTYRLFFIIWAIVVGTAIYLSILALYRLEQYRRKEAFLFIALASVFLVLTSLVPALKELYPFWHWIHWVCAIIHAIFMFLALTPFAIWVSRENPRLRMVLKIWLVVIWVGSVFPLLFFGKNGLFEMWFFSSVILFLLYLSLVLFEEKIVKMSVAFLKDEPNLNLAIEKVYINLEHSKNNHHQNHTENPQR